MADRTLYAKFTVPEAVLAAHRKLNDESTDTPDMVVLHEELAKRVRSTPGDGALLSHFDTLEPTFGDETFEAYNSMLAHAHRKGENEGFKNGHEVGRKTINSRRWFLSLLSGLVFGCVLGMFVAVSSGLIVSQAAEIEEVSR